MLKGWPHGQVDSRFFTALWSVVVAEHQRIMEFRLGEVSTWDLKLDFITCLEENNQLAAWER